MKTCPNCSELFPDGVGACPRDGNVLQPLRDPLLGQTLSGRFRLIERLGAGGMSSVYLARHMLIDRVVAIKMLRRDLANDPVQRDRFLREARAVNRINHENVVEITDFGETSDGLVYLVMEYVPGEPLLYYLRQGPFGVMRALDVAEQCARALARAHQMGIVHRDLKPENILLVQRQERPDFVKLLDFGIAKIMDAPSLTGSQQIFGTPGYIAPEYIQSTAIDGRADLYSLGCILYEMITGALPFDYEYPADLLAKHVTEPPIPPSARLPTIARSVEELILRALAKDPAARFRDAFHFEAELRMVRERLGSDGSWGRMNEASTGANQPTFANEGAVDAAVAGMYPAQTTKDGGFSFEGGPDASASDSGDVFGARHWRARFVAIRARLDELEADCPAPVEIARAMALAARMLDEVEATANEAYALQKAVDALHEQARDLRSTMGRAIDRIARQLSRERGVFEALAMRRNCLRAEREAARIKLRRGSGNEGEADALLWKQAAVEEALRLSGHRCDRLEGQLADLTSELDGRCEALERERLELVRQLDGQMLAFETSAAALGGPLQLVENFLRSHHAPVTAEKHGVVS